MTVTRAVTLRVSSCTLYKVMVVRTETMAENIDSPRMSETSTLFIYSLRVKASTGWRRGIVHSEEGN